MDANRVVFPTTGDPAGMTPANVARDFEGLKGLTDVALGSGFLAGAAASLALAPSGQAFLGPLAGVLVMALLAAMAENRYRQSVGSATSQAFSGRSVREITGMLIGSVLLLLALGGDTLESWPVLTLPVAAAGMIYFLGRATLAHVGLTPVHLAACIALLLVAAAPMVLELGQGLPRAVLSSAAVGFALVATGVTDHNRLMAAVNRWHAEGRDAA